jgi:antitoxin ParD1/3/4
MAAAAKLSVTLTAEMVRDLEASVAAGEFASTSEALRDAVRLWRDRREERAERLAAIRARLKTSAEDTRPRLTAAEFRNDMEVFHAEQMKLAEKRAAA